MFYTANATRFRLMVPELDNHQLQVLSFEGIEAISAPYVFEINLINKKSQFDVAQLLSKPVYLAFSPDANQGIHGVIQSVKRGAVSQHYAQYTLILTPRFQHLYKRTNQRIFQHKTVPQIIGQVLSEHGIVEGKDYEFRLGPIPYPEREYCVQYDESDAYFIQRLCEEEGVHYHFEHSPTKHFMVFGDTQPIFPSIQQPILYAANTGFAADEQVIKSFDVRLASRTQTASWRDYDFIKAKISEAITTGTQCSKANDAAEPQLEFYDYPGRFTTKAQGEILAKKETERLRTDQILASGYSDVSALHSGYYFTLEKHPSLDAQEPWLINCIRHQGFQPQVIEALGDEGSALSLMPSLITEYFERQIDLEFTDPDFKQGYRNAFNATPQEVVWRPARLHPKSRIRGNQTALVTGPANEDIYCDEFGRIKVQFHWDREGSFDENSSCWVRVTSNWAHKGYGNVTIPRIGMEVMVDYLEGDPDQPMVTGCLHNGVNTVPYELPANKTRTVFKTSSSKGGKGSNELRIEDKKGEEQVYVHAEKDFDQLTENNHKLTVENNSHLQVNNEHSVNIKANRYTTNNQEEHHRTVADRKTELLQNDHLSIKGSQHLSVATMIATQAGKEIHLQAGDKIVLDADVSLTLKAGGQHIILNSGGIFTTPMFMGGSPPAAKPALPLIPAKFGELKPDYEIRFHMIDEYQNPYMFTNYIAFMPDVSIIEGKTDEEGYTETFYTDKPEKVSIHLLLNNHDQKELEEDGEIDQNEQESSEIEESQEVEQDMDAKNIEELGE